MSKLYITKFDNQFIVEMDPENPKGCIVRFSDPVPEEYKENKIEKINKPELIEMIEAYREGASLQEAFTKKEGNVIVKMLPDKIRELVVWGPLMVEMFNDIGEVE